MPAAWTEDGRSFHVQEQVKRTPITQEEADLSEMKNILTKALGIQPEMEADPDELMCWTILFAPRHGRIQQYGD